MTSTPPETDQTGERPALDIDWVKTAAGALAAVTAAVLLSTLGAAGTLIGAAVGSVAATVGSAIYAQGLARSREVVRKAGATGVTGLHRVTTVRQAGSDDDEAADAEQDEAAPGIGDRLRALPWAKVALLAAATFVVAMLVITGFEKAAGRSVSQVTGGSSGSSGSTVPGVNRSDDTGGPQDGDRDGQDQDGDQDGDGQDQDGDGQDQDAPSDGATPTDATTPTSGATPSGSATPSPTTTASGSATPTPTPTPSAAPTPSATPRPTTRPSASPSASPTR